MGASPHPLHRIARAVGSLRRPTSAALTADQIVSATTYCLPGVLVGLVGTGADGLVQLASSDWRAADADAWQLELRTGPLHEAMALRRSTGSVATDSEPSWAEWSARMTNFIGFRTVTSVPLSTEDGATGALTVYSARALDDVEHATLEVLASVASFALDAAGSLEELTHGLETRSVIGQAQGLLMERFEIDADRAFGVLRRVSQHGNVKLRVVASEMVRTRVTPGELTADE